MSEISRARYNALLELIAEKVSRGEQPKSEWLDTIAETRTKNPNWVAAPPPPPPPDVADIVPPPPPPVFETPRAAVPLQPGERVLIVITDDVETVIDSVLKVWGARFCVFQNGGNLLELQTDPGKQVKFLARELINPRMVPINSARAWFIAGKECRFGSEKTTKEGTTIVEQLTPDWIGRSIVALPHYEHVPVFSALAQAPTLRPDGALICEPGYDQSTGIYLASDLKIQMPENPTLEDAQAALKRLLDIVCDFDFANEGGPSVWLAGLLSVACRHTFDGPAPIFIIDASKRGAGKTKLADVASLVATGTVSSKMVYTPDDIEMDKRITSLGLAGDAMVCIDNIAGKLASPSLDLALTSTTYKGRVLGKSEMTPALSMKIVWFATGNGIIVGADTSRRALMARLEPPVDHPEDRTGPRQGERWKYPDLLGYVRQHRAELLTDVLTMVSAYIRAGRPPLNLPPMGSFEAWTATIRSSIVWAGGQDPYVTVKDARAADIQDLALQTMVECWPVADGVEVTAAALIAWAELDPPLSLEPEKRAIFDRTRTIREMWRNALLEWLPAKKGELPTARELGYALRSIVSAVICDYRIEARKHTMSGVPWCRMKNNVSTQIPDSNVKIEKETEKPANLSVVH